MLVNLTPNKKESNRRLLLAIKHNFMFTPQYDKKLMEYGIGIYQCNMYFNFSHKEFMEFKDTLMIPYNQKYGIFDINSNKEECGVADNIQQIKDYYKEEIADTVRKFIITFTIVYQDKNNKNKHDGWRWNKWGDYIGKFDIQHEYLDDENFGDDFEYVICFNLIEIIN